MRWHPRCSHRNLGKIWHILKAGLLSLISADSSTAKTMRRALLMTAMSCDWTSSADFGAFSHSRGWKWDLFNFFSQFVSPFSIQKHFGHDIHRLFNNGSICNGPLHSQGTLICPLLCGEEKREDPRRSLILGFELSYFLRPYLKLLWGRVIKMSVFSFVMVILNCHFWLGPWVFWFWFVCFFEWRRVTVRIKANSDQIPVAGDPCFKCIF